MEPPAKNLGQVEELVAGVDAVEGEEPHRSCRLGGRGEEEVEEVPCDAAGGEVAYGWVEGEGLEGFPSRTELAGFFPEVRREAVDELVVEAV